MSELITKFWIEFCSVQPNVDPAAPYQVWYFGNTPEMADELLSLVKAGVKTATASGKWEYSDSPQDKPVLNGLSVVTDFHGCPKLIVKTTEIETATFDRVGAQFAFDEGEGDRSLEYWRRVHWDYFTKSLAAIGKEPSSDMPIICERFEVLYPKPDEL